MKWCNLKINFIWRKKSKIWFQKFSILRSIWNNWGGGRRPVASLLIVLEKFAFNLTGGWQNLNWWHTSSTAKIPSSSASHLLLWYIFPFGGICLRWSSHRPLQEALKLSSHILRVRFTRVLPEKMLLLLCSILSQINFKIELCTNT